MTNLSHRQSQEPHDAAPVVSEGLHDAHRLLSLLVRDDALVGVRAGDPWEEYRYAPEQIERALHRIERLDGHRPVYVVLNPIRPYQGNHSVTDDDILCLRWFPLDADANRPADTASTDREKADAVIVMDSVTEFILTLLSCAAPSILRADSGNGAHALIRLPDYPPSEVKRLKVIGDALCRRFSTERVKMDRSIYNPSRIWRCYGTLNIKGANTEERPHRRAAILPSQADPVPLDLLAHWDLFADALAISQDEPRRSRALVRHVKNDHADAAATEAPSASDELPMLPPWWTEPIKSGSRNETAFRRARWLLNGHEGARDASQAFNELAAWNTTCCRPPLDAAELRKCLASAKTDGDNLEFTCPPTPPVTKAAPWPVLAPEALYGLAGDIVRVIEPHTEADPVALLIQFLIAFGSATNRAPHFVAEADRHGGNLNAVLVGISSKGRKGSSWGHIRRLFTEIDPIWMENRVKTGLSSGEGLIYQVRDPITKEKRGDDGEIKTVTEDEGERDKRLLVLEGEFASVLRQTQRDGNTLSVTIRNAWDGTKLQTLVKNNPTKATNAHISIVGHITRDELRKELSETESANGFGNRFLYVCVKRSKELPDGGQIETVDLSPLISNIKASLDHARKTTTLTRDDTARTLWHKVYHDLSTGLPGLLGAMTARAEAQTMRLALLYALLDRASEIRIEHLSAGLALWRYCEASARHIFGDSLGNGTADTILAALQSSENGLTRSEINDLFRGRQSATQLDQALAVLIEFGRVRYDRYSTGGRPAERWHVFSESAE